VERVFGTLKRGYGFCRTRYLGTAKVELEFLLNAMAFNLKKGSPQRAVVKKSCPLWLANAANWAQPSWIGRKISHDCRLATLRNGTSCD